VNTAVTNELRDNALETVLVNVAILAERTLNEIDCEIVLVTRTILDTKVLYANGWLAALVKAYRFLNAVLAVNDCAAVLPYVKILVAIVLVDSCWEIILPTEMILVRSVLTLNACVINLEIDRILCTAALGLIAFATALAKVIILLLAMFVKSD
jgi:hypothetical protein